MSKGTQLLLSDKNSVRHIFPLHQPSGYADIGLRNEKQAPLLKKQVLIPRIHPSASVSSPNLSIEVAQGKVLLRLL